MSEVSIILSAKLTCDSCSNTFEYEISIPLSTHQSQNIFSNRWLKDTSHEVRDKAEELGWITSGICAVCPRCIEGILDGKDIHLKEQKGLGNILEQIAFKQRLNRVIKERKEKHA